MVFKNFDGLHPVVIDEGSREGCKWSTECGALSPEAAAPSARRRLEVDESWALARRLGLKVVDSPDAGYANITFDVGGHLFGGLRQILALRSDVIDRMCCGDFREGRFGAVVPLPQFSHAPMAFREFLLFLHSGRASLSSASEVAALYEIAEYFDVAGLTSTCLEYLMEADIQVSSAVALLAFAERHELARLRSRLTTFVLKHAEAVLSDASSAARQLPEQVLQEIFSSDSTSASEMTLFHLLDHLEPARQAVLAPLLRLPLISAADIMGIVLPSCIVEKDACLEALAYQADPSSVVLSAAQTRRRQYVGEAVVASSKPPLAVPALQAGAPSPAMEILKPTAALAAAESPGPVLKPLTLPPAPLKPSRLSCRSGGGKVKVVRFEGSGDFCDADGDEDDAVSTLGELRSRIAERLELRRRDWSSRMAAAHELESEDARLDAVASVEQEMAEFERAASSYSRRIEAKLLGVGGGVSRAASLTGLERWC